MTSRERHAPTLRAALVLVTVALGGCWLSEPSAPPAFDCATIDRATERFPDECGDAGAPTDAATFPDAATDAGVDAGP